MITGPSLLSLAAGGTYILVVLACLAAASSAVKARQAPQFAHTWVIIAALFAILAASRLFSLEEGLRDSLRSGLKVEGLYDERRAWQAPVVAAITALVGGTALLLAYRLSRHWHGKRNRARIVAIAAAFVMLTLVAVRLASFHAVDMVLYGPLKLNWAIDMGATIAVLAACIYYVRLLRFRP